MSILTIFGLLVNSAEYQYFVHDNNSSVSLFGKFFIWYIATLLGLIGSVCAAVGI